jgi:hypothetical protein
MFSSFSAGSVVGGCRVTSRCILRSSTQQQQQQRLSSRFSGIVTKSKNNTWKNSNNNIVNKKKHYFSTTGGKETAKAGETAAAAANNAGKETVTKTSSSGGGGKGYWKSAEFWGAAGAMAAWGMSGAAIYDSVLQGPEVISLTMTPVLIVYSGLFARWAWVVKPRNLSLMWCHVANVIAQTNQIRRALEYKVENGEQEQVNELLKKVGVAGGITAAAIVGGPAARSAISEANLGFVSNIAAADAGPFTVHFWYVYKEKRKLIVSFYSDVYIRCIPFFPSLFDVVVSNSCCCLIFFPLVFPLDLIYINAPTTTHNNNNNTQHTTHNK